MALFGNETDKNVRPELSPRSIQAISAALPEPGQRIERPCPTAHGEASAYLDPGTKVSGTLSFEGSTRIDGQVEGEINAKDITIGESAVVTAQITAASIVVSGTVRGEIIASQRIEIRPTAKVSGNITAPKLAVHEGATFDGHCAMHPERAREEGKVAARRKEEPMMPKADGRLGKLCTGRYATTV